MFTEFSTIVHKKVYKGRDFTIIMIENKLKQVSACTVDRGESNEE
jgi:hypothetical protein